MPVPQRLEERLDKVLGNIHKTATKAGRNPKEITLVAITKELPKEIWGIALNANITTLGESKIQETQKKVDKFINRNKIKLHLIGHLQSNKAQKATKLFDVIQTVDSINLAKKINRICETSGITQNIYIQVNVGKDPKKYGFLPENTITSTREITKMKNINLCGIMTIPPAGLTKKELHETYKQARKTRDKIYLKVNKNCKYISMGMSEDYEIAIMEGATHIRIGTALFGTRPK